MAEIPVHVYLSLPRNRKIHVHSRTHSLVHLHTCTEAGGHHSQRTEFRVKKVHLHNVFWAYISDATQIHLTPGRFRLGAAFHPRDPAFPSATTLRPVCSAIGYQRENQASWNPIFRRGRSAEFVSGAGRHEVAIPHRLFMSWFRPASLTACPPREPPPLFEQEHRNAKEPTPPLPLRRDELGLGQATAMATWQILTATLRRRDTGRFGLLFR